MITIDQKDIMLLDEFTYARMVSPPFNVGEKVKSFKLEHNKQPYSISFTTFKNTDLVFVEIMRPSDVWCGYYHVEFCRRMAYYLIKSNFMAF